VALIFDRILFVLMERAGRLEKKVLNCFNPYSMTIENGARPGREVWFFVF